MGPNVGERKNIRQKWEDKVIFLANGTGGCPRSTHTSHAEKHRYRGMGGTERERTNHERERIGNAPKEQTVNRLRHAWMHSGYAYGHIPIRIGQARGMRSCHSWIA